LDTDTDQLVNNEDLLSRQKTLERSHDAKCDNSIFDLEEGRKLPNQFNLAMAVIANCLDNRGGRAGYSGSESFGQFGVS